MKIAVEGCGHGELDKIYKTVQFIEKKEGIKIDLLLCCGDFQAVRNEADMECMAVPKKYRQLNTFYKYYSGEAVAPVLTIFIGGNHEASNYLAELPYGGWVAPNIYYLGYAGIVEYGGVRIGGLSGIFKGHDYKKGHFEMPPYSADAVRSAYHIRSLEIFRLHQIRQPLDIMMSHDWPRGVYHHGNTKQLISKKAFMKEEVENSTLGSGPTADLLDALHPDYWFSAHLHVKFAALVKHKLESGEEKLTKFLALDKCLPGRAFLQILDIPSKSPAPYHLSYDPEWLAILQSTNQFLNVTQQYTKLPYSFSSETSGYAVSVPQILQAKAAFKENMKIPTNFCKTAPVHDPSSSNSSPSQPPLCINPQTRHFCSVLNISDPCEMLLSGVSSDGMLSPLPSDGVGADGHMSDENVNDGDVDSVSSRNIEASFTEDSELSFSAANETYVSFNSSINSSMCKTPGNPDEISLDEDRAEGPVIHKRESLNPSEINISDNEEDEEEGTGGYKIPEVRLNLEKALTEVHRPPLPRFTGLIACSFPDLPETDPESGSEIDQNNLQPKKRNLEIGGSSSRDASDEASLSGDTERSDYGPESDKEDKPMGKKKFKRRNQSIYSSNDGDDES